MKRQINQNIGHSPVQSSTLRSAAYDKDSGDMHVTFQGGGRYVYHGVPEEVHQSFQMSGSKGGFLHKNVKGKYEFTKI